MRGISDRRQLGDRLPERHPWTVPVTQPTREEFDSLKRDIEALKKLLLAAKKYDEATGQPDCETDEKVELIRQVAKYVGVDLSEVFPEKD